MIDRRLFALSSLTGVVLLWSTFGCAADELPPGLVMGLRHNVNQAPCDLGLDARNQKHGGDLGASKSGEGYSWFMLPDDPKSDPGSWHLPPGIVFALNHSVNQKNDSSITAFGHDPLKDGSFKGFKRQHGGDLGPTTKSGDGYYWYESTGENEPIDWSIIEKLPQGTIVGLKHSVNQPRDKGIDWKAGGEVTRHFNPTVPGQGTPDGFKIMHGGDRGASAAGEGYYWFQKVSCPCAKAGGEGVASDCQ